jgi:hypothetical protein
MRHPLTFLVACALFACGGGDPSGQTSTQDDGGIPNFNPQGGPGEDAGRPSASDASTIVMQAPDTAPPPVNDPIVPGTFVPNPQNAFTGAPAYAADPPTIRANDQHGGMIVTGKSCLDCHNGTTCTKFDFAGTVWTAPALTKGAVDVEVRIIDANNYAHDVHSDVDGNFWHRATTDLALPAFSGVRTSDWKAIGQLNGVSCNSCHYAGNTDPDGPPGPQLFVQQ